MRNQENIGGSVKPSRLRKGALCSIWCTGMLLIEPAALKAQTVLPSQVLAPDPRVDHQPSIPPVGSQPVIDLVSDAVAGDERFEIGGVELVGAFPEMASVNEVFQRQWSGKSVSFAELFRAARDLEAAYAREGYVLARVTLPKQRFGSGGMVKLVVTDGYIERVTSAGLPPRLRRVAEKSVGELEGVRHLTLSQIERKLLVLADYPGIKLRSALARGQMDGGVELALAGEVDPVAASLETNNKLPASLGRWQLTTNVAVNDLLRAGEQLYLVAGSGTDIDRVGSSRFQLGMLGGGVTLPIGSGGLKVSAEYLASLTRPQSLSGGLPAVGHYAKGELRARMPLVLTRSDAVYATATLEDISQSLDLPDFATQVSRDHYAAMRLAGTWQSMSGKVPFTLSLTYSHGLGGRKADDQVPLSRQGSKPTFSRVELMGNANVALPGRFAFDVTVRGQHGFDAPLMLPEQFALDADNGVSAFQSGSFNVDTGVSVRAEIQAGRLGISRNVQLAPYLFGAGGAGHLAASTSAEFTNVQIAGLGAGARLSVGRLPWLGSGGLSLGIEYGRQFTSIAARPNLDRLNVRVGVQF